MKGKKQRVGYKKKKKRREKIKRKTGLLIVHKSLGDELNCQARFAC
jgi:hypothetical protein